MKVIIFYFKFIFIFNLVVFSIKLNRAFNKRKKKNENQTSDNPTSRKTIANNDGEGDIFYLAKHNVECNENEALQGFVLKTDQPKRIYYNYSCQYTLSVIQNDNYKDITKTSKIEESKKIDSVYELDDLKVNCKESYGLQRFQLVQEGDSIKYEFLCVKIDSTGCSEGNTKETKGNILTNPALTLYLNKQEVKLEANQILTGFKLNTRFDDDKILKSKIPYYFYSYSYCNLNTREGIIKDDKNQDIVKNVKDNNKSQNIADVKDQKNNITNLQTVKNNEKLQGNNNINLPTKDILSAQSNIKSTKAVKFQNIGIYSVESNQGLHNAKWSQDENKLYGGNFIYNVASNMAFKPNKALSSPKDDNVNKINQNLQDRNVNQQMDKNNAQGEVSDANQTRSGIKNNMINDLLYKMIILTPKKQV
jgi:hypothetical protein